MSAPSVPISWGELIDKMTILEIKREKIEAPAARANVEREYRLLRTTGGEALHIAQDLVGELRQVNRALWAIEDAIREQEATAQFGAEFVQLARSVYRMNDRRAAIKRDINRLLGSDLVEEKCYAAHVAPAPSV
ncbi:MAG TPA: DUF6165 family protein [Sphingobium sp.]|nr:DUF6165 family protein [Sphingobium sp.]